MSRAADAGRRPVRVLHLRDSPWVDGPGRTILETAARIDRSRVDYHVGAFVLNPMEPHPLVDAMRARGLPVHPVPDPGRIGPGILDALIRLIDQLRVDVVHTSEFRSNVLGLLCRRRRPVRLVSTAHGWITNDARGKLYAVADRILLRKFDHVVFVSNATRRRVPRWWLGDDRATVLHNALMTESYGEGLPARSYRQFDGSSEIRLLNVGRLSPEKAQSMLLEAVAVLSRQYPRLRLAFAGIGPLEDQLRAAADRFGIAGQVDFLGYVDDMPALYSKSDLVVQSSLTEGLPNVALEVTYLGIPLVATDVGGTSEVVKHGVTGWVVKPGSVGELVTGIRRFLEQPEEFLRMASRGRRVVEEKFTFARRTEMQARLYEEVAWRAG